MLLKIYKVVYSIHGKAEVKKTLTPTDKERWELHVYDFFAKLEVDENLWKLESGKFSSLAPVLPDLSVEAVNDLLNCDVSPIAPGMRSCVSVSEGIDLAEYLKSR